MKTNFFYERKEGNVLLNDAHNKFYLWLYGYIRHMVKDHSDSDSGNLLPPHWLLFPVYQLGIFYTHYPTDRTSYTSSGTLAGARNSSMNPP